MGLWLLVMTGTLAVAAREVVREVRYRQYETTTAIAWQLGWQSGARAYYEGGEQRVASKITVDFDPMAGRYQRQDDMNLGAELFFSRGAEAAWLRAAELDVVDQAEGILWGVNHG